MDEAPKDDPSDEATRATRVWSVDGNVGKERADRVAVEAPLQINVDGQPFTMTMRTPGHDRELTLGFLFAEGFITGSVDVAACVQTAPDQVSVTLVPGRSRLPVDGNRRFASHSGCGVCGKVSIQDLAVQPPRPVTAELPKIAADCLAGLPDRMRTRQATFSQTGGLHAAALFDANGRLLDLQEDVGRHNALDKLIGAGFAGPSPYHPGGVLVLSGRASFELLQKALMAQIPIVAAVGAPSSAAVDLAGEGGITLVGFLRASRFNVYTHPERIGAWHDGRAHE